MTVELHGQAPPNAEAFVIAWLRPLAGSNDKIGARRWAAGMPLPYRAVSRVTGSGDLITDCAVVRVHTFAGTYTDASREADLTHRRMLLLAEDPLLNVTMANGKPANCEWLETTEGPREEPYGAETVVARFVAQYRLGLHFGPV